MGTSAVSANNKMKSKAAKSAMAIALALLLALGGTFAAFYGTQLAPNKARGITAGNPGGRVHDDFTYAEGVNPDKNVYAESFVDKEGNGEYLLARIRLTEYMELKSDTGAPGRSYDEKYPADAKYGDCSTYAHVTCTLDSSKNPVLHSNIKNGSFKNYTGVTVSLTPGAKDSRYNYMPTFNRDMTAPTRSVEVDVRGKMEDNYANYPKDLISGHQKEMTGLTYYSDGVTQTETHKLRQTVPGYNGVTTLSEVRNASGSVTNCWVYDDITDDGWFYWSSPLAPNTATGLLLDDMEVTCNIKDWFYELNVEGEFVAAEGVSNLNGPIDIDSSWWSKSANKPFANTDIGDFMVDVAYSYLSPQIGTQYPTYLARSIEEATTTATMPNTNPATATSINLGSAISGSKEPIEVYVICRDEENRRALVMSKYLSGDWGTNGLGAFDSRGDATWSTSEARQWCNDTYFNLLPPGLQKVIPEVSIKSSTDGTPYNNETTKDKVFFLSKPETTPRTWTVLTDSQIPYQLRTKNGSGFVNQHLFDAKHVNGSTVYAWWGRGVTMSKERVHTIDISSNVKPGGWNDIYKNVTETDAGARPCFWINY